MKLLITDHNTYKVKHFKVWANTDKYILINFFGFGVWILKKSFGDTDGIKCDRKILSIGF